MAAAGAAWSGRTHGLLPQGAAVCLLSPDHDAGLCLLEAPAIDGPQASDAERLARQADLVVLALHAQQVATESVQAFAARALGETAAVAVVTMVDQVDEDDLPDVMASVQEDLPGLRPLAALTSGIASDSDSDVARAACHAFAAWWAEEGVSAAYRARLDRRTRLRDLWTRSADAALSRMSGEAQAAIDALGATLAGGASAQRAQSVGAATARELARLPALAGQRMEQHLAGTAADVRDAVCAQLEAQPDGSRQAMEDVANQAIAAWVANAQTEVQRAMESEIAELREATRKMDAAMAGLQKEARPSGDALAPVSASSTGDLAVPREDAQADYAVALEAPDADLSAATLSDSEQLSPMLGKGVGVVGAIAAGGAMLLGGPILPLMAAMGLAAIRFVQGQQSVEANRRLLAGRLRAAVTDLITRVQRTAAEDYRHRWDDFCEPVGRELERRMRLVRMWTVDNAASLGPDARQQYEADVRRRQALSDQTAELKRIEALCRHEDAEAAP
jgi:hypothetical protein